MRKWNRCCGVAHHARTVACLYPDDLACMTQPGWLAFGGQTGDTGRLAPLVVPQEKVDMAKAKLLEPQRLSVMLAVASPAIGAMGPNAIELSGANGGLSAKGRGAVRYPQSWSQQVCVADQNVNEGPKSIG